MNPSTTTSQANTGDGTILPPPAAAAGAPNTAPTAQSDQIQAQNLSNTPITPPPSITPAAPSTPAFTFHAPDMPTVGYIDPSGYHDMTALSAAEAAARSGLINQQGTVQKDVFGQYQQAIDSQGSALDQYNKLSQQMNLPLYQQQVNTIKGLLSRLTDDINTRAQGTFMNQAQRDQLEASEGKTLNNQLTPLAQAQTDAENNITKLMAFTQQDNQTKLDPIKAYLASLDSAFGRQLTGLDSNNTSASQALQSRLDAEEQARKDALAQQAAEWTHQNDLAMRALQERSLALQGKYNDIMAHQHDQSQGQAADPYAAARAEAIGQKNTLLSNGNVQPFAREAVLRSVQAKFGLSDSQARNLIYNEVFPDNWAANPNQLANNPTF